MATTAIYCRISQDSEAKGLGVARQEEACRKLAADKGLEVGEVYVDNDVSAFSGRTRPRYAEMMEAIAAGKVGAVIAWHPDRLHRRTVELHQFIEAVNEGNVSLFTVEAGELDLSSASGRLMAKILGDVAGAESEHKSERIKAKHAQKARAGEWSGGPRTFGHTAGMAALEPVEADLIRDAMTRVLAGVPVNRIATEWGDRGIVSPRGTAWHHTSVRRLLSSARIAGFREVDGEWVEGCWPPIVDRADVLRVRALGRKGQPQPPRSYMLTGIVVCGRCGARLKAQKSAHGKRGYVCVEKPGSPGCNGLRIAADELEQFTVEAVFAAMEKIVLEAPDRVDATPQLDAITARTSALAEAFATGELDLAAFQSATAALAQQRIMVEAVIVDETAAQARSGALVGLEDRWPDLGFDDRRAAIAAAVELVTISPAVRGRNRFDADRVEVVWAV